MSHDDPEVIESSWNFIFGESLMMHLCRNEKKIIYMWNFVSRVNLLKRSLRYGKHCRGYDLIKFRLAKIS